VFAIAYQPHACLQVFQYAVAALLVLLAIALTLAAMWLQRRWADDSSHDAGDLAAKWRATECDSLAPVSRNGSAPDKRHTTRH
jgi:hypothetical protein